MYEYRSVLAPIIRALIEEKRAIGFKYESAEKSLKKLDIYFWKHGIKVQALPRGVVEDFVSIKPNETLNNRRKRIADIREVARYMSSHGYSAYLYPSLPHRNYNSSFIPYIFTNEELTAFFKAVDSDEAESAIKYSVIFRMLYSTGMRIGEVLSLTYGDINFNQGTFFIRQGKKNKDRMIPVDKSMLEILHNYTDQHRKGIQKEDHVFVSPHHDSLKHNAVYDAFRKYLWKAGIPHAGRSKGPQLHSFRHTFCVHKMRNWVLEGHSLNALFPYICTYMGHSDTRSTE
ncbi:MAG: tyrosine-type recombinase/integrase [Clostridium sp.]|nr:tyrosine-type recombinase/integrase [Clostridium sp.]